MPPDIHIIDGSPKKVCLLFFVSLWTLFCRFLHLPECLWNHGTMQKISSCSLFLDAAGISFCDGREKFTVFNILTILPALASGCPVIKVSQAMGPFQNKPNRIMANLILPRLHLIAARGDMTARYLEELQLKNVVCFSDCAFSLDCTDADRAAVQNLLHIPETAEVIGISPSQVVNNLCGETGKDYLSELKKVVESLLAQGKTCVIFPHSARTGTEKLHNNDLPLVKRFAGMLEKNSRLIIIDRELEAGELRMLIAGFDILVASRFHAIVSAMAVGVPAAVIGWSHKYAEVLAPFKMDQYVQSYTGFSAEKTLEIISNLVSVKESLSPELLETAQKIRQNNQKFFDLIRKHAQLNCKTPDK